MSGYVVLMRLDGAPVDEELVRQLTDYLSYRGPDGQAARVMGAVGMGHALFTTTQDVPALLQPATVDRARWIVGDIRIDDRANLVARLHAAGCEQASRRTPDAELALWAYRAWGDDCVASLLGDFSFVIWDEARRRLFGVRDHFGVKPFYYAQVGQTLILSNTLNCIRQFPGISDELNNAAILDFLLCGFNYDRATTTFKAIQRLPPGHCLICEEGALRIVRYWSLPTGLRIEYKKDEEYVEHFRELFTLAVSDRLRVDHVGVTMSGGMDSTSVAATAQRVLTASGAPFELRSHTITSSDPSDHEGELAQVVAQSLGMVFEPLAAETPRLFQQWEDPTYRPPEPVNEPLLELAREMMRRAAQHERVMLSGLGGDPLFMLSESYLWDGIKAGRAFEMGRRIFEYTRSHNRLPPLYLRSTLTGARERKKRLLQPPTWIAPALASQAQVEARWWEIHDPPLIRHPHREAYRDITSPYWQGIFFERFEFGNSRLPIETRYPFFDVRLVNYVFAIPPMPWCTAKELLRRAMRGWLPEVVRTRPKTPLARSPIGSRLSGNSPNFEELLDKSPRIREYIDRAGVLAAIHALGPHAIASSYTLNLRPVSLSLWLCTQL